MIRDPLYNPLDPATLVDPYPVYDELRSKHPVYWHEQLQSWVLTRHDDCRHVLSDHETFARDWRRVGDDIPNEKVSVQGMDPPEMVPLRRLFAAAFRALDMRTIAARARACIEARLGPAQPWSDFDVMTDLADPLADCVTGFAFGVEPPGSGAFARIAYGIALAMDSGLVPEQRTAGAAVSAELRGLIRQWMSGAADRQGLVGMIAGQPEIREWHEGVIVSTLAAMVNAAWSTIYASTGNAVLTLLRNPEAREQLTPENLDTAVDELLRFDSPAHATSRVATRPTRLGGVDLDRGSVVVTILAAANRDPERFASPHRLVLDRSPNPHLGFGWGPHSCLGAALASIVMRELVDVLAARPPLQLAGVPRRYPTATLRYLAALPVEVTTRSLEKAV